MNRRRTRLVAIAAARSGHSVVATDLHATAVRLARSNAALNGVALKAERAGKIKTTIQLTSSFIILVLLILGMWSKVQTLPQPLVYLGSLAGAAGWWLTVVTAFFTVISGAIYLTNHRDLISRSWNEKGQ